MCLVVKRDGGSRMFRQDVELFMRSREPRDSAALLCLWSHLPHVLHDKTNLLGGGDAYEYTRTKTDVGSVLTKLKVLGSDRPVMTYGPATACSNGFVCGRMLGSILIRDGCCRVDVLGA